jgi:serine/threonine-protein kinase
MICPDCRAPNDAAAESCFTCGRSLLAPHAAITRGTLIAERYEVLSPLGRGGMGMVYKAHDRVLDETVAVKTLRADLAREADSARRFRTEIKLARKIRHRNVCAIHEYGEAAGVRFIAMELVDGVDLRRRVREGGALSGREAFEVAIQAAQGLQAIHNAGIIHRDLKSSNIMRDGSGRVRLMDFGIAKQFGTESTLGGRVVGTPEYMSPEQARGHKVDFRSDIYALGIVIYEVFTGRVPFQGDTPIATILMHLNDPPPLEGPGAPAIPSSLVPVLRRALAKSPEDRFPAARDLAAALEAARAGSPAPDEPITADFLPRDDRSAPSGELRRVLESRWPAAVAALALGLGLTLAVARRDDPPSAGVSLPPVSPAPPPAAPSLATEPTLAPATQAPQSGPSVSTRAPAPVRAATRSPGAQPAPATAPAPSSTALAPPAIAVSPPEPPGVVTPPPQSPPVNSQEAPNPAPTRSAPPAPRTQRGDLVEASDDVTLPTRLNVAEPVYPPLARRLKRQAEVLLRALVDENGKVVKAEVVRGDDSRLGFDEAALDAAYKTRYKPAQKDGVAVKIWIELPVTFRP